MKKQFDNRTRLAILQEYLITSASKKAMERHYDLSHGSIYRWLRTFAIADKEELNMMKSKEDVCPSPSEEKEKDLLELRLKVKLLESALKDAEMVRDAYACMIDMAEAQYHIKVRKNSAAK